VVGPESIFISLKRNKTVLATILVIPVSVLLIGFLLPQLSAPDTTVNDQGEVVPLDDVTRSQLVDDRRKTWAQIAVGIIVMLGVLATFRRTSATERTVHLLQEGQITERFTRAIDQLGSDNTAVCLGGIYTLERIAKDSPNNDHRQVMEVLTAYVRENAQWIEPAEGEENQEERPSTVIQAILTVLGRRNADSDGPDDRLDLSNTNLQRANLEVLSLARANFAYAHLEGAFLLDANLEGAYLPSAHLERAFLSGAHLEGARLLGAHLEGANLYIAHMERASLSAAHLEGAILIDAHLEGAFFSDARLEGAYLSGAHLEGAILYAAHLESVNFEHSEGLTKQQLDTALWDEHTQFPEGFEPPPMRQN